MRKETKRTEGLEEAGYRSPTCAVLRALQQINTATILILFAFITGISSLVPLLEGLLAQIHMNMSSLCLTEFEPETCG